MLYYITADIYILRILSIGNKKFALRKSYLAIFIKFKNKNDVF